MNLLSDDGDLTISFNLYFANSGDLVTNGYTIDLESELYGELKVDQGGFSALDVHFEDLTASSSGASWPLISDG